ncbi:hypothetical protein BGX20_009413 [Mortierella sp. AD010]|nr:hypothetical protein BGX20_009413 [Mortierella sp. AD010]
MSEIDLVDRGSKTGAIQRIKDIQQKIRKFGVRQILSERVNIPEADIQDSQGAAWCEDSICMRNIFQNSVHTHISMGLQIILLEV